MPRGDRTGPDGNGPMSGRAAGYCAGFHEPGYANSIPPGGRRAARGRPFGRAYGRGAGRPGSGRRDGRWWGGRRNSGFRGRFTGWGYEDECRSSTDDSERRPEEPPAGHDTDRARSSGSDQT